MSNSDPTALVNLASYHRHKFHYPFSSRCCTVGEQGLWLLSGTDRSMDSRDRHRRRQTSSFAMGRDSFFQGCFAVIMNYKYRYIYLIVPLPCSMSIRLHGLSFPAILISFPYIQEAAISITLGCGRNELGAFL